VSSTHDVSSYQLEVVNLISEGCHGLHNPMLPAIVKRIGQAAQDYGLCILYNFRGWLLLTFHHSKQVPDIQNFRVHTISNEVAHTEPSDILNYSMQIIFACTTLQKIESINRLIKK